MSVPDKSKKRPHMRSPGAGLFSAVCLVLAAGVLIALPNPQAGSVPSSGPKLQEVLAGMDKAAATFTSMVGDLEYTKVTVIVNDHSTQLGKIRF